jgi:formylglycine-generating enzyme required for sulfatase activity
MRFLLVLALALVAVATTAAESKYPLWDGKESVAEYAKRAELEPKQTVELAPGVKLELVLIPAGKFTMGSPKTEKERQRDDACILTERQFNVTISKPFYMGKYEATQRQYKAIMGVLRGHMQRTLDGKRAEFPVIRVSWKDAQAFCEKISKKTGKTFRLPTEAEWEFACRAGTTTPFYTGEQLNPGDANYYSNKSYNGSKTAKYHHWLKSVGSYPPNPFGLHDMIGNVSELCQDFLAVYPEGEAVDPIGKPGETCAVRGEGWGGHPEYCRSACRSFGTKVSRTDDSGFRVVMLAVPPKAKDGK